MRRQKLTQSSSKRFHSSSRSRSIDHAAMTGAGEAGAAGDARSGSIDNASGACAGSGGATSCGLTDRLGSRRGRDDAEAGIGRDLGSRFVFALDRPSPASKCLSTSTARAITNTVPNAFTTVANKGWKRSGAAPAPLAGVSVRLIIAASNSTALITFALFIADSSGGASREYALRWSGCAAVRLQAFSDSSRGWQRQADGRVLV